MNPWPFVFLGALWMFVDVARPFFNSTRQLMKNGQIMDDYLKKHAEFQNNVQKLGELLRNPAEDIEDFMIQLKTSPFFDAKKYSRHDAHELLLVDSLQ